MNNLNSILVEGSLVRDPIFKHTPKGTAICTMTIATNRYHKGDSGFEKEVSFFDIEAWSKLGESIYQKAKKGRGVRVVGRLKQDRWQDTDGKNHARVKVVAEHIELRPEFLKNKKEGADNEEELAEIESSFNGECHDLENDIPQVNVITDDSLTEEVA
jgi:single-strand DNA-binding protein